MEYNIKTKKGLEEEWKKVVEVNTSDEYSKAVVEAAVKICLYLEKGYTPAEAESKALEDCNITGFQAGAMASIVSKYHEKGDEFKKYWNNKFNADDREDVVNPAIVEIIDKNNK